MGVSSVISLRIYSVFFPEVLQGNPSKIASKILIDPGSASEIFPGCHSLTPPGIPLETPAVISPEISERISWKIHQGILSIKSSRIPSEIFSGILQEILPIFFFRNPQNSEVNSSGDCFRNSSRDSLEVLYSSAKFFQGFFWNSSGFSFRGFFKILLSIFSGNASSESVLESLRVFFRKLFQGSFGD